MSHCNEVLLVILLQSCSLNSLLFFPPAGLQTIAIAEVPFVIDRSPPVAGTVNDGNILRSDLDYQNTASSLCVNWDGFSDPHSGLGEILWSIGMYIWMARVVD